jgi:HNH endonuclease
MKHSNKERICKCGYSKHVEICHIKEVKSFPDDAKIKEINDPSNLLYLCPNCHWEFDNSKK